MKKKLPFIISGVVIVIIIAAMVIFAFTGRDDVSDELPNVEGVWKVAVRVSSGNVSVIDNEYIIFNSDTASCYRDGEVFAESGFTLDTRLQMNLPDIGQKYSVVRYTDNYIRLDEGENTYMDLIRYGSFSMDSIDFDTATFDGTWNIAFRKTDRIYAGDYMVFENGTAVQYSGGTSGPVATSTYSWQDGNHLLVDTWLKELVVYPVSDSIVMMVELSTDTGYIWELQRAE